jgi:hypothetical protein
VPNTLAYYNSATITAVKSFIVQTPALLSVVKSYSKDLHMAKINSADITTILSLSLVCLTVTYGQCYKTFYGRNS